MQLHAILWTLHTVYYKSFEVEKFCGCKIKIGWTLVLYGQSLLQRLGKVLWLLKPRNFSTSNDLQCTVLYYELLHIATIRKMISVFSSHHESFS